MMNNFKVAIDATQTAYNSQNSAIIENQKYMNSYEGLLNKLKAVLEGIVKGFVNSDVFKSLLKVFTEIVRITGVVVSAFGNWGTALLGLTVGARLAVTGFRLLANHFVLYVANAGLAKDATTALSMAQIANMKASELASVGWNKFTLALARNPITAILVALSLLATAILAVKYANEETQAEFEASVNQFQSEQAQLDELIKRYEMSANKIKTDVNAKKELFDIQLQLIEQYGDSAKAIDLQTSSIDENIAKIRELGQAKLEQFILENTQLAKTAQNTLSETTDRRYLGTNDPWYIRMLKGEANYSQVSSAKNRKSVMESLGIDSNADTDIKTYQANLKTLIEFQNELRRQNSEQFDNAWLEDLIANYKEVNKTISESESALNSMQEAYKKLATNSIPEIRKLTDSQLILFRQLNSKLPNGSIQQYTQDATLLSKAILESNGNIKTLENNLQSISSLQSVDLTQILDTYRATQGLNEVNDAMGRINSSAGELETTSKVLNTAFSEMADNGSVSWKTAMDFLEQFPEKAENVKVVNKLITIQTDQLTTLWDIEKQRHIATIEAQKKELEGKINLIKSDAVYANMQLELAKIENISLDERSKRLEANVTNNKKMFDEAQNAYDKFNKEHQNLEPLSTDKKAFDSEKDFNPNNISDASKLPLIQEKERLAYNLEFYRGAYQSAVAQNNESPTVSTYRKLKSMEESVKVMEKMVEVYNTMPLDGASKKNNTDGQYNQNYVRDYMREITALQNELDALVDTYNTLTKTSKDFGAQLDTIDKIIAKNRELLAQYPETRKKFESEMQSITKELAKNNVNPLSSENARYSQVEAIGDEKQRTSVLAKLKDFDQIRDKLLSFDKDVQKTQNDIIEFQSNRFDVLINQLNYSISNSLDKIETLKNAEKVLSDTDSTNKRKIAIAIIEEEKKVIDALSKGYEAFSQTQAESAVLDEAKRKKLADLNQEIINHTTDLQGYYNTLLESQQTQLEKAEALVVKMLKDRYETELEYWEKLTKNKEKLLQKQLSDYKNEKEAELEILERQQNQTDYNSNLADERKKETKLRKELSVLELDTSIENKGKIQEAQEKLAEQTKKITDMESKHSYELRKKNIQDMVKNKETEIDKEKEKNDKELESHKTLLDKKLQEDSLHEEARKAILSGTISWLVTEQGKITNSLNAEMDNQVKITDKKLREVYKKWEEFFGKGKGLVSESITKDNLDLLNSAKTASASIKQLTQEKKYYETTGLRDYLTQEGYNVNYDANSRMVTASKGSVSSSLDSRYFNNVNGSLIGSPYAIESNMVVPMRAYLEAPDQGYQVTWDAINKKVKVSRDGRTEALNTGGFELRDNKYYTNIALLKQRLKDIGFYQYGGIVTENQLAMLHGDTTNWEAVLQKKQLTSLISDAVNSTIAKLVPSTLLNAPMVSMPRFAGSQNSVNLHIGNLVNVEGNADSSSVNDIQKAVENGLQKVIKQLNLNGLFRGV